MIENARLAAVYQDLEEAIASYNKAHDAYRRDLRQGYAAGRTGVAFDVATRRYEARERAFNREVSEAIKATGEVPSLAEDMLEHQRRNGFHAKGLVKIISGGMR